MWQLLTKIWNGLLGFLSLLLPVGKGVLSWRMGPGARWVLHIVLLALIVVGLFFLNRWLAHLIEFPLLRNVWLPVIFLLVYLLIWTGWWIWKLAMAAPEPSSFPDIDAAWEEAMRALGQAGIRPVDMPMFLILGRPEAPEDSLFQAAGLQLVVKQSPVGPLQPLHVYANREAIFVTCPGASLLGKHAALVSLEGIDEFEQGTLNSEEEGGDEVRTIRPTGKGQKKVIKQLANIVGRTLNVVERRSARRDLGLPMPDLLKSPTAVERLQARLAHLCRLMVRDRAPFCAVNGVLVLVPVGATDTDHDAQQTAEVCSRDLRTLRQLLRQEFPIFALGCDLEALPGFRDFIQRVSPKDRLGRLGQRFPLAPPDLAGEALEKQIDRSIHHLCSSYLREWVFRLFRADATAPAEASAANSELYLFLDEMRSRMKNLSRILTQGVVRHKPAPLLYGGCYLAGTGADKAREQAFVAGVFKRLLESQNFVAWTEDALVEDRRGHSRANLGYTLLALVVVVLAAGIAFYFFGPRRS